VIERFRHPTFYTLARFAITERKRILFVVDASRSREFAQSAWARLLGEFISVRMSLPDGVAPFSPHIGDRPFKERRFGAFTPQGWRD
jgi:hypothetical protein